MTEERMIKDTLTMTDTIEDAEIKEVPKEETKEEIPPQYQSVYRKTFEFGIKQMVDMFIKNIDATRNEVLNMKPGDWEQTRGLLIKAITDVAGQIRAMPWVIKTESEKGPTEIVLSLQQDEIIKYIMETKDTYTFKNGETVLTITYDQMKAASKERLEVMIPWIIGDCYNKTQEVIRDIQMQKNSGKTNSEILIAVRSYLTDVVTPYYESL